MLLREPRRHQDRVHRREHGSFGISQVVQGEHGRYPRAFAAGDGLAADPVAAIGQEDIRPENLQSLGQERQKRETFGPGRVAAVGDGWAVDGDGHLVLAEIGDGERSRRAGTVADQERDPQIAQEIARGLAIDEICVREGPAWG